jgi:hypothetical protein
MLGLALRGASAISKVGRGAQMARAITGRKRKQEPGKTKPGGDEGGGGGGTAIIKAKVVSAPASAIVPVDKSPNVQQGMGSGIISILETIRANVKEIDDFYKGTVAAKREEIKKRKKQASDERKAEQETKLEKPKVDKKPDMKLKGLKMPKTGILDGIFRFISNVLMGMLVMKLIDFADTLQKSGILPLLGKIGDFILDIGGKILNGLITFIDKGYELYDGLRKSIGDTFGEGAQEQFDKLASTLNKVLNTVFSVGLAISLLAGAIPQKKPKPKVKTPKPKPPTKVDKKLKKMGLDEDQIKAYNKARQGGAGATDALKQARKVKPKPKPKPKGFFGRIGAGFQAAGEGLTKFGKGAVDLGVSGLKSIGGGLNKIVGGNLGKLGDFLGEQYKNVSKGAKAAFDRVAGLGNTLKSKFGSAMDSVKGAIGNMAESAKKAVVQKIIEPIKPFLEPIIDKAKQIGDKVIGILKKIPGFDNVLQVLKKKGVSGLGDAAGILKKAGSKALPIVGGIFNLLFAYDRLAGGDTFGALLELLSAGLDISGLFGFAPGPGISMGIDAYMFARDFVPLIQEGEEKAINAIGLGGFKSEIDKIASKLPDLGSIVKMFGGEQVEQKSAAEIASTTGDTSAADGTTPAPAASDTPATTTTTTTTPDVTPEEQGDASEAAQRIVKDFPQIASRASSPQIYASGLGFYLKKVGAGEGGKGDFGDPYGAPHGGMEHPDHGGVVGSHAGTGHARGVAVDLGGNSATSTSYQDDQKKLWPFITNYLTKYGLNKEPFVPQVIHGPGENFSPRKMDTIGPDAGHKDHFHVEFEGGGYVGSKYNMRSLERRASYEGGEQMIDIPIPTPQQASIPPEPEMIPSGSGSFSAQFKDDFEFLEFQG